MRIDRHFAHSSTDYTARAEEIGRLRQQLSEARAKRAGLAEELIHLTAQLLEIRRAFGNPFYYSQPQSRGGNADAAGVHARRSRAGTNQGSDWATGKHAHTTSRASRFRPHPWHGLEVGPRPPEILNAFIEITPFDLMKYEVDKVSGYLRVDRPQRSSAQHPTLYGFIPRTYCAERVRALAPSAKRGDGDPLDSRFERTRDHSQRNHRARARHRASSTTF